MGRLFTHSRPLEWDFWRETPWSHPCPSLRILPGQVPPLRWSNDCSVGNSPFQAPQPLSTLADHHTTAPPAHRLPVLQKELLEQMPPPALPAPSLMSWPQAGLELLITTSLASPFHMIRPAVLRGQGISSALPILIPQSHSWPLSLSTTLAQLCSCWFDTAPASTSSSSAWPGHGDLGGDKEAWGQRTPWGHGEHRHAAGLWEQGLSSLQENSHIRANLPVK